MGRLKVINLWRRRMRSSFAAYSAKSNVRFWDKRMQAKGWRIAEKWKETAY
jgi:hypothetical protein